MDGRRFDRVTRALASGASRRSVLRGLLGLGGAAATGTVVSDEVDARSPFTRPRIPPPPPPTTTTTTTTTAAPCGAGEEQCPNSTRCCPTGTCARSGNAAICCDGTDPHGTIVCGLDCCDILLECCDGECCPSGTVCLARVFGEGPFVEEEVCCPIEDTCRTAGGDGICCDGACFDPELMVNDSVLPLQVDPFERTCCPEGGVVCPGSEGTLCCIGDTPQCCEREGVALCLPEDACCLDTDCPGACSICNPDTNTCEDADSLCTEACEICYLGQCVSECSDTEECCERTVQGVPIDPVCLDPATQCCVNADCFDDPFNFDRGCVACPATGPNAFTCDPRNEGELCGAAGECDVCYQGQCLDTPCPTTTTAAPCVEPDFACGEICCPADAYDFCCSAGPSPVPIPGFPECCAEGRECDAIGRCCELNQEACEGVCVPRGACPTTTTTSAPTTTTSPCPPNTFFCPGSGPGLDACCAEPCCGDVCCAGDGVLCCFGQTCQLGECCNASTCVALGYGDIGCVSCALDQQTGATSCIVADTGESCGSGLFCCEGDCTSGPQCGDLVCCFGEDCTSGECCDTFDCVELGYGNSPDCVSCTAGHVCVVEINNGTVCGVNPDAVCCSGFCTTGTSCDAPTTTAEPPLCTSLGGACGPTLPSCCEGVCSPPDGGRCCIPDTQPCPPNPDDCCGACTPGGTCGD